MDGLIIFGAKYLFVAPPLVVAAVFLRVSPAARRALFLRGLTAGVVAIGLTLAAGSLYHERRPFVVNHVRPLIPHVADNGFPSDHTTLTFTCAFLLLPFSTGAALAAAVLAALVGAARVASRLHTPLDVAAGIAIALLANLAAALLVRHGPGSRVAPAAPGRGPRDATG